MAEMLRQEADVHGTHVVHSGPGWSHLKRTVANQEENLVRVQAPNPDRSVSVFRFHWVRFASRVKTLVQEIKGR
jgi:hypothetical protein